MRWSDPLLIALFVAGGVHAAPDAGTPTCTPASRAAVQPELDRLAPALRAAPGDPMLLFEEAIAHAMLCNRTTTLERLSAVSRTWGGLDPGNFRGFAFLRGDPEFDALVRDIRARNPPVLSSQPAFVLAEPGLFPEGMAFDAGTGRVYAGSAARQRLVWTDRSGTLHELVAPRAGGLGFPAGMKVDAPRNRLCVASAASFGPGRELPDAVTGILCFALDDGRPVRTLRLPAGWKGFLNDLAIDPATGTLYTTNTSTGAVLRATLGDTDLRELLPDDAVPGANGIALDASGRVLFVAGDEGITRVDLGTKKAARLERAARVVVGSIDGLYFWKGSLVGIQNGVHPGRVLRFQLDGPLRRIERSEVLEAYAPWMEGPTTGAIDGDSLLYLANTQLRRWLAGADPDPAELVPVQVRRIALRKTGPAR
jgi:sugar lactone lactonase YvrE